MTAASVALLALLLTPVSPQAIAPDGEPAPSEAPVLELELEPAISVPAGAWDQVFSVATIQPRLHADGVPVVVVPAGDHPQAELAVRALKAVLAASHRVTLARRAAPVTLGDDGEIARRVAKQGYDRVVVVRTFDVDGRVQAVIGVLDAEGRMLEAFVAWSDEPLAAPGGVALGVTEDALVATIPEHDGAEAPHQAELTDAAVGGRHGPGPASSRSDRGRGEPAGRRRGAASHGRASTHGVRLGVGLGMIFVGAGTFAVGLPLALADRRQRSDAAVASVVLGAVVASVGITLAASVPFARRSHRRSAKTHDPPSSPPREPAARTLSLHPMVSSTGGGAVLEGRF